MMRVGIAERHHRRLTKIAALETAVAEQ